MTFIDYDVMLVYYILIISKASMNFLIPPNFNHDYYCLWCILAGTVAEVDILPESSGGFRRWLGVL